MYLTGYGGFCRDGDCLILPTWNHLWFVAYLWVYTLLLWVLLRAAPGALTRLRALRWTRRFAGPALVCRADRSCSRCCASLLAARFPSTHALVDDWYQPRASTCRMFVLGVAGRAACAAPWQRLQRLRWHRARLARSLGWVLLCV